MASCNFEEIFEAVKGKDYLDIIFYAEQEATEAERFLYRKRTPGNEQTEGPRKYAEMLKDLICFLRYEVTLCRLNERYSSLFQSMGEDAF